MLFKHHLAHQARSAGTGDKARIKVNQKLIDWADIIFVMEYKHRDILKLRFITIAKPVMVLNIADSYQFNDPELIEILKQSLKEYLA